MNVSFIGAGNVATHLAKALYREGVKINVVVSRREESAKELANQVDAQYFSNMKKFSGWDLSDAVILAVNDEAINQVIQSGILKNSKVFHTSGSYDSNEMKDWCKVYGSFYPFQTFRKTAAVDLESVPFFLESSANEEFRVLKKLAGKLSDFVFEMESSRRRHLHISGVFVNNFLYYLLNHLKNYCHDYNIDQNVLEPLLNQTVTNALKYQENLQTGPAVRGDLKTIDEHLEVLNQDPTLKNVYLNLSQLIYKEFHGKEIEL